MGEIIELRKQRPAAVRRPAPARAVQASWNDPYAFGDLTSASVSMWRSAVAAWYGLWLAPLGLRVTPALITREPPRTGRVAGGDPRG